MNDVNRLLDEHSATDKRRKFQDVYFSHLIDGGMKGYTRRLFYESKHPVVLVPILIFLFFFGLITYVTAGSNYFLIIFMVFSFVIMLVVFLLYMPSMIRNFL